MTVYASRSNAHNAAQKYIVDPPENEKPFFEKF